MKKGVTVETAGGGERDILKIEKLFPITLVVIVVQIIIKRKKPPLK